MRVEDGVRGGLDEEYRPDHIELLTIKIVRIPCLPNKIDRSHEGKSSSLLHNSGTCSITRRPFDSTPDGSNIPP